MTHDELVERAVKWLAGTRKCYLVMDEPVSAATPESPDAIGWYNGGRLSILVECKTSLNDFYRDKRKPYRQEYNGMGKERWYMTPPGLLKPEQIPEGWGLIEARKQCRTIVRATPRIEYDWQGEMALLITKCVGVARRQAIVFEDEPEAA